MSELEQKLGLEPGRPPMPSDPTQLVGLRDVVVRGFGYEITHAARVPAAALEPMTWIAPFTGVRTPIVGRCGKRIRSVQKAVVVMKFGTEVSCDVCKAVLRHD